MKVERWGAYASHGTSTVIPAIPLTTGSEHGWNDNVKWDSASKEVRIHAPRIPHQDGKTTHNYIIRLSLSDVASLLTMFGHAATATDASLLRDELGAHIPALVKLLACATGLVPSPIPVENTSDDHCP